MENQPGWVSRSIARVSAQMMGLRISADRLDSAECDLLCIQHPHHERTLTRRNLVDLIDAHHELLRLGVDQGLDLHSAQTTMWGGDVSPEAQAPGVDCTVASAHRGLITVARVMAPSFRRLRGLTVRHEMDGPALVDAPVLLGALGVYFAGHWEWTR